MSECLYGWVCGALKFHQIILWQGWSGFMSLYPSHRTQSWTELSPVSLRWSLLQTRTFLSSRPPTRSTWVLSAVNVAVPFTSTTRRRGIPTCLSNCPPRRLPHCLSIKHITYRSHRAQACPSSRSNPSLLVRGLPCCYSFNNQFNTWLKIVLIHQFDKHTIWQVQHL